MTKKKQDAVEPKQWTVAGFLDEFKQIDTTMEDRSFLFLLGAGASVTSGIKPGGVLAQKWLEELHRQQCGDDGNPSLDEWATADNLNITGFDAANPAASYPQIYDRRFGDDPERGYAYLEDVMSKAEPSIGYSILAQVLAKTRHKVVVTTNFDNLVADSLSIYTDTFPLVCGHESLTGFVQPKLRRPLVAKIHRDLLLAPISDTEGTACLEDGWADVLKRLLREYTPIVLGYGGNDGSLMGLLEKLEPGEIRGGMYWCYRRGDGQPSEAIRNVVAKHKGKLVPIIGFDEFMIQVGDVFNYELLDEEITKQAEERVKHYRDQFEKFQAIVNKPRDESEAEEAVQLVRSSVAKAVKKEKNWWAWELKAKSEENEEKREEIYRQGLREFPSSHVLIGCFALFMHEIRKKHDEAEQLYRRTLEIDSENATNMGNFALFMSDVRRNYDEAERLYRRSLKIDSKHANNIGNFASFLLRHRSDYDEVEWLYRQAITLDPEHMRHLVNFGVFLCEIRKNYDEAENLYRRALILDKKNVTCIGNYAGLMFKVRKNYDEAERLYRQALDIDSENVNNIGNFASFMSSARKNYDEAERLYQRAIKLDPNNASVIGRYATFLFEIRKTNNDVERLFERAIELDPKNAMNMGNYSEYLLLHGEQYEAKEKIDSTLRLTINEYSKFASIVFLWCVWKLIAQQDSASGLARLKWVIQKENIETSWNYDELLKVVKDTNKGQFELFKTLSEVILDTNKLDEMERFPEWKDIEPISPEEPWDDM